MLFLFGWLQSGGWPLKRVWRPDLSKLCLKALIWGLNMARKSKPEVVEGILEERFILESSFYDNLPEIKLVKGIIRDFNFYIDGDKYNYVSTDKAYSTKGLAQQALLEKRIEELEDKVRRLTDVIKI